MILTTQSASVPDVEAKILTAPAMGAEFAEYLLTVPTDRGTKAVADGRIESCGFPPRRRGHVLLETTVDEEDGWLEPS